MVLERWRWLYGKQNKNNSETTYHSLAYPDIIKGEQPNDVPVHQLQNSTNKTYNKNYNVSAGFVYDLSDKTSINLTGLVRTFEETAMSFWILMTASTGFTEIILQTFRLQPENGVFLTLTD